MVESKKNSGKKCVRRLRLDGEDTRAREIAIAKGRGKQIGRKNSSWTEGWPEEARRAVGRCRVSLCDGARRRSYNQDEVRHGSQGHCGGAALPSDDLKVFPTFDQNLFVSFVGIDYGETLESHNPTGRGRQQDTVSEECRVLVKRMKRGWIRRQTSISSSRARQTLFDYI